MCQQKSRPYMTGLTGETKTQIIRHKNWVKESKKYEMVNICSGHWCEWGLQMRWNAR